MANSRHPPAGLLRRIAAALYDALLVIALQMLATLLLIAARGGEPVRPGDPLLQAVLLITAGAFFVGFWTRGGQTLGMNAWRLRVEMQNGKSLPIPIALLRFGAAILSLVCVGMGFLWQLVDRQNLTWHDRIAGTQVVLLPKRTGAANERGQAQSS